MPDHPLQHITLLLSQKISTGSSSTTKYSCILQCTTWSQPLLFSLPISPCSVLLSVPIPFLLLCWRWFFCSCHAQYLQLSIHSSLPNRFSKWRSKYCTQWAPNHFFYAIALAIHVSPIFCHHYLLSQIPMICIVSSPQQGIWRVCSCIFDIIVMTKKALIKVQFLA